MGLSLPQMETLLERNRLVTYFQPILSLSGKRVFGVEALVRGVGDDGSLIAPDLLFDAAREHGLDLLLDARSRKNAIERFLPHFLENPRLVLFLNFESKLIDRTDIGRYTFDRHLQSLGIPPRNVVLEIKEDAIKESDRLKAFCDHFRALGFNIALDDFGAGNASFDRIGLVRPDLIKIDRSLVRDMDQNYIHRQIVHAIANMGSRIGALVLAEGVERCEEAQNCLSIGITLFQGFLFARPSDQVWSPNDLREKMDAIGQVLTRSVQAKIERRSEVIGRAEKLSAHIHTALKDAPPKEWHTQLSQTRGIDAGLEAIYFLDSQGRQIGDTVMLCEARSFFEPARHGSDHSLKEYFYLTQATLDNAYLTKRYISLASGNMCRTYARKTRHGEETIIVCIDFKEQESEED